MRGHPQRLAEHAINPHPDDQPSFIRLNMDVGHPLPNGLGDDTVDEADRGRVVSRVEQVLGTRDAARQSVDFLRAHRYRSGLAIGHIMVGEQTVECRSVDPHHAERLREMSTHFEQDERIGIAPQRNIMFSIFAWLQHNAETARERIWKRRWVHGREPQGVGGRHYGFLGSERTGRMRCEVRDSIICGGGGGAEPLSAGVAPAAKGIGGAIPI